MNCDATARVIHDRPSLEQTETETESETESERPNDGPGHALGCKGLAIAAAARATAAFYFCHKSAPLFTIQFTRQNGLSLS